MLSRIANALRNYTLEVIPNVYQITTWGANMILITEDELTLIDTGFRRSLPQIQEFIQRLGRSVEEISLIIITHNHLDHAGGLPKLKQLSNARVAASPDIISKPRQPKSRRQKMRRLIWQSPFSNLSPVAPMVPKDVDIKLKGGETLKPLGGLEVILTPGHTADSISLYSPRHKLLIVGDALSKHRHSVKLPPIMVRKSTRQARDSVKKLGQLDVDTICFGHGRPMTDSARTRLQELVKKNED